MSVSRKFMQHARPHMLPFLFALAPLGAVAQSATEGANDPQAPVPPAAYTSAVSQYQAAPAGQPTPDKGWVRTNEAVRVSAMDHSKMDHSKMDHSKMNHGQEGH
jgi:hypothetical protein